MRVLKRLIRWLLRLFERPRAERAYKPIFRVQPKRSPADAAGLTGIEISHVIPATHNVPVIRRREPLFDRDVGLAMPVQKAGAQAFFSALRVFYLPRLALRYLRTYDVAYALQLFLDEFGLSFAVLTDPAFPQFEEQRETLAFWVGIYAAAEAATHGTPLEYRDDEFFAGRDGKKAEALLEQVEACGALWRNLHSLNAKWPAYLAFQRSAAQAVCDWRAVAALDLDRIRRVFSDYLALQTRVELASVRHDELRASLRRAGSRMNARALGTAQLISDRFVQLQQGLDQSGDPAASLQSLEEILDDFDQVLSSSDSWSAQAKQAAETELQEAFRFFGMLHDADFDAIKKKYRQLAGQWHPDRNPGKNSEERFKNLTMYYARVEEHFRNAVGSST